MPVRVPTGMPPLIVRLPATIAPILAAAALVTGNPSVAATAPPDVCHVLRKTDIFRLLGWNVEHVRKRIYHFGTLSGAMCNYESPQGIVTTIVPDAGTPFPGLTAENTPDAADLVQSLPGLGAQVEIFNGTVFVTRPHKRIAVHVVPESAPASYADVEPFAEVLVERY